MKNYTILYQKNDISILMKGIGHLGSAIIDVNSEKFNRYWINSSVKPLIQNGIEKCEDLSLNKDDFSKNISDSMERLNVVKEGLKMFSKVAAYPATDFQYSTSETSNDTSDSYKSADIFEDVLLPSKLNVNESIQDLPLVTAAHKNLKQKLEFNDRISRFDELLAETTTTASQREKNIRSISDEDLMIIGNKLADIKISEFGYDDSIFHESSSIFETAASPNQSVDNSNITTTRKSVPLEKIISPDLQSGSIENVNSTLNIPLSSLPPKPDINANTKSVPHHIEPPSLIRKKPLARNKAVSTLSSNAQARKVPQSRLGRLMSFGNLAAGLGVGTLAEMTRRTLGVKKEKGSNSLLDSSPFLTEANAKRIVDTLCQVRGAALKLGQMLSIQDNAMINSELQTIFERVRQSADFMPMWQLERTLTKDFGADWRDLVSSFDDRPFAAASIGQVHQAVLHDGRAVAMKVQYPGVAEGIESDINNLITTLNLAKILPEGLYVESAIDVAKKELRWECDYERERECTEKYRELVKPFPHYYVPEVIGELCAKQVFTTELIEGISVDKCVALDQETRDHVSSLILKVCLLELFYFGFMQTDPNWANFFYNKETKQMALLDFGACRDYDKTFVDDYINVIHGAATRDRAKVEHHSKKLGFLTGYEAKVMVEAHVDAVMILGEAFQDNRPFSFGGQDTTRRIQRLIPVMLAHRMCPPPEESYSLHRKMSGVFLLCAKLNGFVNCKPFFDTLYDNYQKGNSWEEIRTAKIKF